MEEIARFLAHVRAENVEAEGRRKRYVRRSKNKQPKSVSVRLTYEQIRWLEFASRYTQVAEDNIEAEYPAACFETDELMYNALKESTSGTGRRNESSSEATAATE
ncbi:MAG: hypothetical protein AB7U75_14475 [Hyphomicrobiaceae bacterium]